MTLPPPTSLLPPQHRRSVGGARSSASPIGRFKMELSDWSIVAHPRIILGKGWRAWKPLGTLDWASELANLGSRRTQWKRSAAFDVREKTTRVIIPKILPRTRQWRMRSYQRAGRNASADRPVRHSRSRGRPRRIPSPASAGIFSADTRSIEEGKAFCSSLLKFPREPDTRIFGDERRSSRSDAARIHLLELPPRRKNSRFYLEYSL